MQILTGPATGAGSFNHLARIPPGQITFSPALDAIFGAAGLYDGNTEVPIAKFGSIVNPSWISANLDLLAGTGDFETGIVSPWVIALGTCVVDATFKNTGNQSAMLGATSTITANLTCRAGEPFNIAYAIAGDGTRSCRIRFQNLDTGNYWTGSAWVSAATDFDLKLAKVFKVGTATFTVEPIGNAKTPGTPTDVTTIQIQVLNTGAAGNVWVDSVFAYPSTSFAGLFGHNTPPSTVVTLLSSTTGAFAGEQITQATLNGLRPNMWAALSLAASSWAPTPFAAQYVRFNFAGTPQSQLWFSEAVLGQLWVPSAFISAGGITYDHDANQIRNVTPSGQEFVTPLSYKLRTLKMTFPYYGLYGQFQDMRDFWIERAQSGGYPTILLAPEVDPDLCAWGRLQAKYAMTYKQMAEREGVVTFKESPMAIPGISVTA
jgi:hypothetical protein